MKNSGGFAATLILGLMALASASMVWGQAATASLTGTVYLAMLALFHRHARAGGSKLRTGAITSTRILIFRTLAL